MRRTSGREAAARPAPPASHKNQERNYPQSHVRQSQLNISRNSNDGIITKPKHPTMPQLISPLALRALRTLVQRPALTSTPLRTLTTSTSAFRPQPALTSRFNFQPVFRTQTVLSLSATARRQFSSSPIIRATYNQVRRGCRQGQRARRGRSPALKEHPALKGVCLKTGVTKPKKPNSGERKIARVRLSTGKVITAIIPGEGMYPRMLDNLNYRLRLRLVWIVADSWIL